MTLHILIVDDDRAARFGMARALQKLECTIHEAADGKSALQVIDANRPDLIFLDLNMPGMDGLEVLDAIPREARKNCEIIVVTANDSLRTAVACIQNGATDYITKPYEIEQIRAIARRNLARVAMKRQVVALKQQLETETAFGSLIGISPSMKRLYELLGRAARAPLDVLIRGETGTGKELIAREIHRLSARKDGPFVTVNTAAISETLAESQLFGHKKGAFTGADRRHAGLFEQADGGTLFLDEIGDMPPALQAKVLRALQERRIQLLGGSETIPVDLRVITATHQDLEQAIAERRFREDLYYRIKGIELTAPPLRKRREDILLLARYFLQSQTRDAPPELTEEAEDALLNYPWPGNVRELRQVIGAAAVMADAGRIEEADLNLPRAERKSSPAEIDLETLRGLPLSEAKTRLLAWFERERIEHALTQTDGNISAAARVLGIHRQSLQQKMQQLGIRRDPDRGPSDLPLSPP